MQIRLEHPKDISGIREVNIAAFGRDSEADLVDRLRGIANTISYVAVESEQVIGHIFFSPLEVRGHPEYYPRFRFIAAQEKELKSE